MTPSSFAASAEPICPEATQRKACEALLEIAVRYGARVLLNGSETNARGWGCAGIHWTAAVLAAASARPADLLCSASCHTRDEIAKAGALALDFALLGPVAPTPTHPQAIALGWTGFAAITAATAVPVFALGGLSQDDLAVAIEHGAHGVALRRAAWRA